MVVVNDYNKFNRISAREVKLENSMDNEKLREDRLVKPLKKYMVTREIILETALDTSDTGQYLKKNLTFEKMMK
jgi:hypothetical protein